MCRIKICVHHDVRVCSRVETGHQRIEMCPLKTKGTHLSSSQRRCKELSPRKNTKPEHCLRAPWGRGWVGLSGEGGGCIAWRARLQVGRCSLAVGRLSFPLIVFNVPAIAVDHESPHFLSVAPTLLLSPYTTLGDPQSFRNPPPGPGLATGAASLVGSAVTFTGQRHV